MNFKDDFLSDNMLRYKELLHYGKVVTSFDIELPHALVTIKGIIVKDLGTETLYKVIMVDGYVINVMYLFSCFRPY
ncbi:MAG: hypothetical protein J6K58_14200 [Lachnospiraceae bacterium]|nr:hypothetical protein [Lachnospiraceae bacterium]